MSCSLTGDDAVTQASDAARAFGELQWLGEDELARLSIVIEELIANLYEHGGVSRGRRSGSNLPASLRAFESRSSIRGRRSTRANRSSGTARSVAAVPG